MNAAAPRAPALALDIGGTKLAAAVVNAAGRIHGRARVPTPPASDAEAVYEQLLTCAFAALRGADTAPSELAGVGVGCAGPMRWPDGVVSPLNMPAWREFPLRARLVEDFALDEVRVHNDAVAIVAGEHWRGAGRDVRNLLGLTVSTGVGGGLVLAGRLHHGATGNGGHIGHVVVEPDGPECRCGGRGCLEAVASGPNAVRLALAGGWQPPSAEQDGRTLAAAAAAGDAVAASAVARSGSAIGRALASVAALLDLDLALVVGGFSLAGEVLWQPLRETFARHAGLDFVRRCRVEAGAWQDAALLGAAAFVLEPEYYGWSVHSA